MGLVVARFGFGGPFDQGARRVVAAEDGRRRVEKAQNLGSHELAVVVDVGGIVAARGDGAGDLGVGIGKRGDAATLAQSPERFEDRARDSRPSARAAARANFLFP